MIAFGLVGGQESDPEAGQENGRKRIPMSVTEITKVYEDVIPSLFAERKIPTHLPITPYSRVPLEEAVKDLVKNSLTYEFKLKDGDKDCIAGAVAREYNEDPRQPDILKLFDSESDPVQLVREVILASSNAPIYFKMPSLIGGNKFIDGGVGGMKSRIFYAKFFSQTDFLPSLRKWGKGGKIFKGRHYL